MLVKYESASNLSRTKKRRLSVKAWILSKYFSIILLLFTDHQFVVRTINYSKAYIV